MGNIIAFQTTGDTAEFLSRRFGKIRQDKESITINSGDTSVSKSKQLDFAIPASTIGSLSSGEACGIIADNPNQKIKLKKFHGRIMADTLADSIESQSARHKRGVSEEAKSKRYLSIKKEARQIVLLQLTKMLNTPTLAGLVISKNRLG
jgi:hypothetical protein